MEEIEIILEKESNEEINIDLINEGTIIYPQLENLEVTPTLEEQRFKHPDSYGYDEVVVKSFDLRLQDKEVTPTKEIQEVDYDTNYIGLNKVIVNAIPDEYNKTSGTLEIKSNGEYDVIHYEKANVNIGEAKKGLVINEIDDDGYAIDFDIVGMEDIPDYYFQYTYYKDNWLSRMQKELILPDNLKSIGSYAFYQCNNLLMDKLPDNLKSIGSYAFASCSNITISELPIGITTIEDSVFRSCSKIKEMTCKGNLTKIGSNAFGYSSNFSKLVLPNVTSVPKLSSANAFTSTRISGGYGYIYVPDNLVDSFKSASNWSTYASQIKGVSEL